MALQPDGKIIVLGDFEKIDGTPRDRIARLNADGSLDASFQYVDLGNQYPYSYRVFAVAVQNDGKVIIAGDFREINSVPRSGIARLNPNGTLDSGFDPGDGLHWRDGLSLAIQPDGRILVGGSFDTVDNVARGSIARLNADGSLDTSFDPAGGTGGDVLDIALQNDGKILVAGYFDTFAGQARDHIARLESDGTLDVAYNPSVIGLSVIGAVRSICLQSDGKLLVGGSYHSNGTYHQVLSRLETNGAIDGGFTSDPNDTVYALALDSSGRILVGGGFTDISGTMRNGIARLDSTGAVDTSFDPGSGLLGTSGNPGLATCVVSQADGKIVVGGFYSFGNDAYREGITRFEQDGSVDSLPGPDYHVDALTALPDGRIIAGGRFGYIGNARRGRIARLNPDFTADSSFDPGAGVYGSSFSYPRGYVRCTAVQGDGKVILGGSFETVDNVPRLSLARLNSDGSLDTGFNPVLGGFTSYYGVVYSTAVQLDGRILIAGNFTVVNGQRREYIARLNADGSLDTGFQPIVDDVVVDVEVLPNGSILMGGMFTTVDFQARAGIARLASNGSLDGSFNPLLTRGYGDPFIEMFEVQQDGAVVIRGGFDQVNGVARAGMARLASNGVLDAAFDPVAVSDGYVREMMIQSDGRILLSGTFLKVDGQSRRYVARLESDGSLDSSFNATSQLMLGDQHSNGVWTMLVEPDGRIVIGGRFRSVGGDRFYNLARLSSDGTLSRTAPSLRSPPGDDSDGGGCVAGTGSVPGAVLLLVVLAVTRRRARHA